MLARFLCSRSGLTSIEYSLIAAIMGLALVVSYEGFMNSYNMTMGTLTNTLKANQPPENP